MPIDPQSLYVQIGQLIASVPDFGRWPPAQEQQLWLGRAAALVEASDHLPDLIDLRVKLQSMNTAARNNAIHEILGILYRVMARAELAAPVAAQGAFIPTGAAFDAFAAVGKVLREGMQDLLIVDPYMDETILSDFVSMAKEGVKVRLLSDQGSARPSLGPSVHRWSKQYGATRPVEARLAERRQLHDRVIVVDGKAVWSVTQSFKDLRLTLPATLIRVDGDARELKRSAYEEMWENASPLGQPNE